MELVRKVLRSLPPSWHTKATIIEESKNLSTLSLEKFIGSLMTYEINVKKNEDDSKKKKIIALKAMKAIKSSSEDEKYENTDDEDVAMLTHQGRKFLQKKRRVQGNNYKKFLRKVNSDKVESSKDIEIMCYECKKLEHMQGKCLKL